MNIDDLNQFQLLYYSFITVTVLLLSLLLFCFVLLLYKHPANFRATERGKASKSTVWKKRLETVYFFIHPKPFMSK